MAAHDGRRRLRSAEQQRPGSWCLTGRGALPRADAAARLPADDASRQPPAVGQSGPVPDDVDADVGHACIHSSAALDLRRQYLLSAARYARLFREPDWQRRLRGAGAVDHRQPRPRDERRRAVVVRPLRRWRVRCWRAAWGSDRRARRWPGSSSRSRRRVFFDSARFISRRCSGCRLPSPSCTPTWTAAGSAICGWRRRSSRCRRLSSGHGAVFLAIAMLGLIAYRVAFGEPIAFIRRLRDLGVTGALLLAPAVLVALPVPPRAGRNGLEALAGRLEPPLGELPGVARASADVSCSRSGLRRASTRPRRPTCSRATCRCCSPALPCFLLDGALRIECRARGVVWTRTAIALEAAGARLPRGGRLRDRGRPHPVYGSATRCCSRHERPGARGCSAPPLPRHGSQSAQHAPFPNGTRLRRVRKRCGCGGRRAARMRRRSTRC